ncbi:MAG TPA: DUF86 domain-containing protein [Clostridiales bacterium]|nr:DUF86 domain-containing protein [Clostridiales bacterium]HQP69038.1 DUF86 domain-containing protein [Clostridiales bacterium]
MSDSGDVARLESVLEYIDDISRIIERHENLDNALNDFEGQYAIMMCMQQIGDTLNKMENPEYIKVLPIRQAYGFRNILAHDYGSVNLNIAKDTIEKSVPELKSIISSILK